MQIDHYNILRFPLSMKQELLSFLYWKMIFLQKEIEKPYPLIEQLKEAHQLVQSKSCTEIKTALNQIDPNRMFLEYTGIALLQKSKPELCEKYQISIDRLEQEINHFIKEFTSILKKTIMETKTEAQPIATSLPTRNKTVLIKEPEQLWKIEALRKVIEKMLWEAVDPQLYCYACNRLKLKEASLLSLYQPSQFQVNDPLILSIASWYHEIKMQRETSVAVNPILKENILSLRNDNNIKRALQNYYGYIDFTRKTLKEQERTSGVSVVALRRARNKVEKPLWENQNVGIPMKNGWETLVTAVTKTVEGNPPLQKEVLESAINSLLPDVATTLKRYYGILGTEQWTLKEIHNDADFCVNQDTIDSYIQKLGKVYQIIQEDPSKAFHYQQVESEINQKTDTEEERWVSFKNEIQRKLTTIGIEDHCLIAVMNTTDAKMADFLKHYYGIMGCKKYTVDELNSKKECIARVANLNLYIRRIVWEYKTSIERRVSQGNIEPWQFFKMKVQAYLPGDVVLEDEKLKDLLKEMRPSTLVFLGHYYGILGYEKWVRGDSNCTPKFEKQCAAIAAHNRNIANNYLKQVVGEENPNENWLQFKKEIQTGLPGNVQIEDTILVQVVGTTDPKTLAFLKKCFGIMGSPKGKLFNYENADWLKKQYIEIVRHQYLKQMNSLANTEFQEAQWIHFKELIQKRLPEHIKIEDEQLKTIIDTIDPTISNFLIHYYGILGYEQYTQEELRNKPECIAGIPYLSSYLDNVVQRYKVSLLGDMPQNNGTEAWNIFRMKVSTYLPSRVGLDDNKLKLVLALINPKISNFLKHYYGIMGFDKWNPSHPDADDNFKSKYLNHIKYTRDVANQYLRLCMEQTSAKEESHQLNLKSADSEKNIPIIRRKQKGDNSSMSIPITSDHKIQSLKMDDKENNLKNWLNFKLKLQKHLPEDVLIEDKILLDVLHTLNAKILDFLSHFYGILGAEKWTPRHPNATIDFKGKYSSISRLLTKVGHLYLEKKKSKGAIETENWLNFKLKLQKHLPEDVLIDDKILLDVLHNLNTKMLDFLSHYYGILGAEKWNPKHPNATMDFKSKYSSISYLLTKVARLYLDKKKKKDNIESERWLIFKSRLQNYLPDDTLIDDEILKEMLYDIDSNLLDFLKHYFGILGTEKWTPKHPNATENFKTMYRGSTNHCKKMSHLYFVRINQKEKLDPETEKWLNFKSKIQKNLPDDIGIDDEILKRLLYTLDPMIFAFIVHQYGILGFEKWMPSHKDATEDFKSRHASLSYYTKRISRQYLAQVNKSVIEEEGWHSFKSLVQKNLPSDVQIEDEQLKKVLYATNSKIFDFLVHQYGILGFEKWSPKHPNATEDFKSKIKTSCYYYIRVVACHYLDSITQKPEHTLEEERWEFFKSQVQKYLPDHVKIDDSLLQETINEEFPIISSFLKQCYGIMGFETRLPSDTEDKNFQSKYRNRRYYVQRLSKQYLKKAEGNSTKDSEKSPQKSKDPNRIALENTVAHYCESRFGKEINDNSKMAALTAKCTRFVLAYIERYHTGNITTEEIYSILDSLVQNSQPKEKCETPFPYTWLLEDKDKVYQYLDRCIITEIERNVFLLAHQFINDQVYTAKDLAQLFNVSEETIVQMEQKVYHLLEEAILRPLHYKSYYMDIK